MLILPAAAGFATCLPFPQSVPPATMNYDADEHDDDGFADTQEVSWESYLA